MVVEGGVMQMIKKMRVMTSGDDDLGYEDGSLVRKEKAHGVRLLGGG